MRDIDALFGGSAEQTHFTPESLYCAVRCRHLRATLRSSMTNWRPRGHQVSWDTAKDDKIGEFVDVFLQGMYGHLSCWDVVCDIKAVFRESVADGQIGHVIVGNLLELVQRHDNVDFEIDEEVFVSLFFFLRFLEF